ncbi:MAG: STAS/SEC14 domain-containing protein [Catalinimonas sp.]
MSTVTTTKCVELSYEADVHAIFINWKTAPTSAEFRDGMNAVLDMMRKHNTGVLLGDTCNLGALNPDDQAWSFGPWLQEALSVGYERFAVVISPDIFAQMSVEDTLQEVQATTTVTIRYFDDLAAARAWLRETK